MAHIVRGGKPVIYMSDFEKGLILLLNQNFKEWKRFTVHSMKRKFKPSEDRLILGMKGGEVAEICEVYFDNDWLTDISANLRPDEALAVIQFALMNRFRR